MYMIIIFLILIIL